MSSWLNRECVPDNLKGFVPANTYTFPNMKGRGRWSGIVGLILVSLVAASCGGASDTGGTETTAAPAAADTVPDATAETTATTAAPATTAAAPTATTEAATETTSAPTTTAAPDPAPTEGEASPEVPAEEPETTTTTTPAPEPVGPPAPDFTLELGSGGTFVLSQQTTPVVIFFWAEW